MGGLSGNRGLTDETFRYETRSHESSAITLFDVQKWIEEFQGDSNEVVYTLKTINQKLKAKYGNSLQFTSCEGQPSIMLLYEDSDQIVLESSLETVSNSCNVEEDLKDFVFRWRRDCTMFPRKQ